VKAQIISVHSDTLCHSLWGLGEDAGVGNNLILPEASWG
jgi:hypothetical protein